MPLKLEMSKYFVNLEECFNAFALSFIYVSKARTQQVVQDLLSLRRKPFQRKQVVGIVHGLQRTQVVGNVHGFQDSVLTNLGISKQAVVLIFLPPIPDEKSGFLKKLCGQAWKAECNGNSNQLCMLVSSAMAPSQDNTVGKTVGKISVTSAEKFAGKGPGPKPACLSEKFGQDGDDERTRKCTSELYFKE
jgi:hypothetical protein